MIKKSILKIILIVFSLLLLFPFNLVLAKSSGLVPCGRSSDDPKTEYNETKPCELKDIFLLFKNIVDFILWEVGLIVLVLLIVVVGLTYFFSGGTTPETVKSILNSAGKGYGIMFFAWIIINFILAILGYKVEIFGRWWQIKF